MKRFILRNWLIHLWKLASPKSVGWACRLETQARADAPIKSKGHLLLIPSCSGKSSLFVLFSPSTDWMRPTHITEGNLFYSKSTTCNVNLLHKHLHRNFQNDVPGHCGPARLHIKLTITYVLGVLPSEIPYHRNYGIFIENI